MRKISKILKILLVGAFIMHTPAKEAKAFFLIPPMPWDFEFDIPAFATKLVAQAQSEALKLQTGFSMLNTEKLDAIKKGVGLNFSAIKNKLPTSEGEGKAKTPMKKTVTGNEELGIEENDLNEKHYFDAYYKLFFVYPEINGNGSNQIEIKYEDDTTVTADYPVLQTAYKHKEIQYRQDVIVDTYLTGRLTEDYLAVVDKTLQRLDMCLNKDWSDAKLNAKKCTFFGLQMVEVKNNKEAPSDKNNAGQLGAAMNAYIVSTVYDRLLRIVEDLTATEAIYRAAKQLDIADPIMPSSEKESSAETYIRNAYQFAHNEVFDHYHAAQDTTSLLSKYKRSEACAEENDDCSAKNKDSAELKSIEDTEILGKLKPIEEMLELAVQIHNLKNQMPEYKTQFRKYKKAQEVHERALKAVKQSDKCVKDFLERHGGKGSDWGETDTTNDYENRTGISRALIMDYEKVINDTIIGSTSECEGYYDNKNSCPEGYEWDETVSCQYTDKDGNIVSKLDIHPCVIPTVAYDIDDAEKKKDENAGDGYNDADYLINSGNADKMELENRKKGEQAWRIGYEKIMELTENGDLKFAPWNDQQNLQQEYLHNKYRNIRMIIKSVDQGVASYKIASELAGTAYTGTDPILDTVKQVTICASLENARIQADNSYCAGYPKTIIIEGESTKLECSVTKDNNTGIITGKRQIKDNGEIKEESKIWKQIVTSSTSCPFKSTPATNLPDIEIDTKECHTSWDFTVGTLVKKYFPVVLGGCSEKPAERVYTEAKKHGRRVAKDYLNDVITARNGAQTAIKNLVKKYNNELEEKKGELQKAKEAMQTYNETINKATEEKNRWLKELRRTNQRISDIKKEKEDIDQRLKSDLIVEEDKCSLNIRLTSLDNEISCISNQNPSINTNCPAECSDKEELREKQCQSLKTLSCKTYVREELPDEETSELTFVIPDLAQDKIDLLTAEINIAKEKREVIKDEIQKLEKNIREKAIAFAEDYLNKSGEGQAEIEKKNKTFEDFLETSDGTSKPYRMIDVSHTTCCGPFGTCSKHCEGKFEKDNLQTTLEQTTYHGTNLEEAIKYGTSSKENKESLSSVLFDNIDIDTLTANLVRIGVPATFVTDGTVLGLEKGPNSAKDLAKAIVEGAIKEKVLSLAAKKIAGYIRKADEIIETEVDAAVEKVNDRAEALGVLDTSMITKEQASYILDRKNYGEEGEIVKSHNNLIKNITTPTSANESILKRERIILSDIFGIPYSLTADEEYFVGLPARGSNYSGEDTEENNDDGRDYRAPKEPLPNLPPVREVFYYSALDYDDTPKSKSYPVISYLLNFKYPDDEKIEYLPEIWRYLLARPNLRPDGQYQRTFVERSLSTSDLEKLLGAPSGESSNNYRTILSRGGIYPCKLGSVYIDIEGANDNVSGITYRTRKSLPQGIGDVPLCQEVAFNNVYSTNSCYSYNKGKGGICHLMADHGKRPDIEDIQTSLSQKNNGLFDNYSELGQFLDGDLKYRALQENVLKYQIDSTKDKNDITRRKAITATFTHNVMGSFLEAVNMEHGAKENLDKTTEDMKNMLKSLCEQIHEADWNVSGEPTEDTEKCVSAIMTQGLAKNGDDKKYGVDGEYSDKAFEGITCAGGGEGSLYETIFCKLDDLKEEALNKATTGYKTEDEVKVAGFNEVAEENDSRIQERIDEMQKYIDVLTKDEMEIVFLTPDITIAELEEKIKTEKTNRTSNRITDEDGIKSMDNQSQSVAYCPIY